MKYQRFVAYVYEYRKGKKESNCGFLKVEARDENVTIEVHMKCPGLPAEEICSIYGFKRASDVMEGHLLGTAYSGKEKLDCIIESANSGKTSWEKEFSDFGGIVILTEHGAFFGTEWDDQMIRPDKFKAGTEETSEDLEMIVQEDEPQTENLTENANTAKSNNLEAESFLEEKEKHCLANEDVENGEEIPNISKQISDHETANSDCEKFEKKPKETTCCVFHDDEIAECRLVQLNELFKNCPPACSLRNNRFLNHGFYNFGHLLIGKKSDGQQIIGVPGRFDQQEQFMANMFGFPFFKESCNIQVPGGRGGYWYRSVNSANFH